MSSTIKAIIRSDTELYFVAECSELSIVVQGKTLDEVTLKLHKAVRQFLQNEGLTTLGSSSNSTVLICYEMENSLFLGASQSKCSWRNWKIPPHIIAGFVVISLWLTAPFLVQLFFSSWSERGQFGDLFGSVNALFSGLAFVGLIYTIHLQRQELVLQRMELKLQREEMIASRGELAAQVAVQKSLVQSLDKMSLTLQQAFSQLNTQKMMERLQSR